MPFVFCTSNLSRFVRSRFLLLVLLLINSNGAECHLHIDVTPGLVTGYPLALKHNALTEVKEWKQFTHNVRENGITITFANVKLPRLTLSNFRLPFSPFLLLKHLPPITLHVSLSQ